MNKRFQVSWPWLVALVTLMWGSVLMAEWAKPKMHWSDHLGNPKYENVVPKQFGDWQLLEHAGGAVLNPVQEQRLLELYTETLARTYVHRPTGRMVMLSIAYGKDQSTDTQIHTPDACYPSQGFRVDARSTANVDVAGVEVPLVRLKTSLGMSRIEPLTYFIRVGNVLASGSAQRNLARLEMAMRGYLVDGMLFRVSEISTSDDSYEFQLKFIRDLIRSVPAEQKHLLLGREKSA
jgi:EpsI family protein